MALEGTAPGAALRAVPAVTSGCKMPISDTDSDGAGRITAIGERPPGYAGRLARPASSSPDSAMIAGGDEAAVRPRRDGRGSGSAESERNP